MIIHKLHQYICWLAMALTVLALLSSCNLRQKIVYVQGAAEVGVFDPATDYEARIACDQLISILVTCSDLKLAAPFNLQRPQIPLEDGGSQTSTYLDSENLSYHVDAQGDIVFPVLGKLHVAGMTRRELSDYLANFLVTNDYIVDPVVNVSFNDLHYTVMGEVNTPGVYQMKQERVTLFEAIASAGDMTVFGERDKVRLIRTVDGKEHVVTLNMMDPQVINSPYYFLRNGDVLYVEPNRARAANREVSNLSNFTLSLTSILVTVASLVITIVKL